MIEASPRLESTLPPVERPLRIASCINSMSVSGGSELNAVRTAEQLVQRGHSVSAVTLTDDTGGMWPRYRAAGIEVHGFPVRSLVGLGTPRQIIRAARFFRRARIDVVHAHDCYSNFLMVPAARLAGIPVIASKRWIHQTFRQHRYTDLISFHLATRVLANSDAVGRTLREAEWVSADRISVVPNFLDDDLFSSQDRRAELRAQFGFDDTAVVFCIVAQLRAEKNHALLLDAFSALVPDFPTARLLIIGDGPERANIERRIRELCLADRVCMIGYLPRAGLSFVAADVAMLPSQHEGFPNALIEAMATGTAVIASDVGGIPDAVVNGETGLLVPPNDVAALVGAMRTLASDSAARDRLGMRGHHHALARYGAAGAISLLSKLYFRALGARP